MRATVLLIFLLHAALRSQNLFTSELPLWNHNALNNFRETSDEGFILATDAVWMMDTTSAQPRSFGYLIRLDRVGKVIWQKKYPKTSGMDKPQDGNPVTETNDHGFLLATALTTATGRPVCHLIRTDPTGNIVWTKKYPVHGISTPFDVEACADGGFIVCGTSSDTLTGQKHAFLFRTDAAGTCLWSKSFSDLTHTFYSVTIHANGFAVAGARSNQGVIVFTNPAGTVAWSSAISDTDCFYGLMLNSSGHLVASGFSTAGFTQQAVVLELHPTGTFMKKSNYATLINAVAVTESLDGKRMLFGEALDEDLNSYIALVKTNTDGSIIWSMGEPENPRPGNGSLVSTQDGAYAFYYGRPTDTINSAGAVISKVDASGEGACGMQPLTIGQSATTPTFIFTHSAIPMNTEKPASLILENYTDTLKRTCLQEQKTECLITPNTFTPNADGYNDYFEVISKCESKVKIEIYNRWGMKLYEGEDRWDGIDTAGRAQADGTYFYIIRSGEETLKGFLTLLR
jgi:gliding motility-associated-like protein